MNQLQVCFLVELCVAFGVGGLFWPDRFMPVFDVLMFPWVASARHVRAHSIGAIAAALLLLVVLIQ
jgi:hypothetical protein